MAAEHDSNGQRWVETIAPTPSSKAARTVARALGWFSIGLGMAQLLAPRSVSHAIGVQPDDRAEAVTRAMGARELASGTLLLASARPVPWLWLRAAGDLVDLGLLASARGARRTQRRPLAAAMALAAGALIADAAIARRLAAVPVGPELPGATPVRSATTIARSPQEVYAFWRNLENLPSFMSHVEAVEVLGDRTSRWTIAAPAGRHLTWEAEVTEDTPGKAIAWRSLPGARIAHSGAVRFRPVRDGRATEVQVELWHTAPAGRLGEAVAKLFGEEPNQQVDDDLRRLKQVLETGEVTRSSASPDGLSARQQMHQRPAQPLPHAATGNGRREGTAAPSSASGMRRGF